MVGTSPFPSEIIGEIARVSDPGLTVKLGTLASSPRAYVKQQMFRILVMRGSKEKWVDEEPTEKTAKYYQDIIDKSNIQSYIKTLTVVNMVLDHDAISLINALPNIYTLYLRQCTISNNDVMLHSRSIKVLGLNQKDGEAAYSRIITGCPNMTSLHIFEGEDPTPHRAVDNRPTQENISLRAIEYQGRHWCSVDLRIYLQPRLGEITHLTLDESVMPCQSALDEMQKLMDLQITVRGSTTY
ncbi:hypothetical protein C8J56DRAFT_903957 [Mycena floridula]|nr:hypothetical protein C8J56DRAFT_903957 [Mycena floridula]